MDNEFNPDFFDSEFYNQKTGKKGAKRDQQSPFYIEFSGKFKAAFGNQIKTILDIGCGMGFRTLNHIQNGYDATGCDISKWAFENSVLPAGKHICCDMRLLNEHAKAPFDCVIVERSIEYLPAHSEAMNAITSLSSGYFVFSIICSDHADPELVKRAAPGRLGINPKKYWLDIFNQYNLVEDVEKTNIFLRGKWDCIWVMKKK